MVAVAVAAPLLCAAKEAILPVPLAANPITVLLFVHDYKVPVTGPVKFIGAVKFPAHNV